MDNYEVNFSAEHPEDQAHTISENTQPVSETPPITGHQKVSPFADSPYIMNHQPQSQAYSSYQQPQRQSEPAPKAAKKRSGKVWKVILSCVLIAALVATGCGITAYSINSYWARQNEMTMDYIDDLSDQIEDLQQQIKDNSFTGGGNSISGSTNVSSDGLTPGQVYAKCVNSVVAITANVSTIQGSATSAGSGFIISEDGYIISNYHVVEGAASLTVTTHSGEQYTAEIIGYDDTNDLALLKADATGLTAATLGSSSNLIVGDQVVAIGNPLGELNATLTVGYVSGKDRTVTTDGSIINMIQTDAAINPGNSGGPLFNMKGQVIGITTAKYSGTTSSGASIEGIGFAIPIDDVAGKIVEIQQNGYVSTPYMGIEVTNQFDGMGVYVSKVEAGGAAEAAGVKVGDLIVALGDYEVNSLAALTPAMKNFKVGDTTTITVYRSSKLLDLTITFGEKPHETTQTPSDQTQAPSGSTLPEDGNFQDWWDYYFGSGND